MTHQERDSLLVFCTQEFEKTHCFIDKILPKPEPDGEFIKSERRDWCSLKFSGFKEYHPEEDVDDCKLSSAPIYLSWIVGQRSDGCLFRVMVVLPMDFEPDGDPVPWLSRRIVKGLDRLDTFLGCTCGIIGCTVEGNELTINSPCLIHQP